MKFDRERLASLKSLQPEAIRGHVDALRQHEGPGFLKVAAARTAGVVSGIATEALLGTISAFFIPEGVGIVGEVIAPFISVKVGGWVNKKVLEKLSDPSNSSSSPPIPPQYQAPSLPPRRIEVLPPPQNRR